jgi:hypothetical protein
LDGVTKNTKQILKNHEEKEMKKQMLLSLAAAMALNSTPAMAIDAPWLGIESEVNFDVTKQDGSEFEETIQTRDAEITFEVLVTEGLKFVVQTELERLLRENGEDQSSEEFDMDSFIEQAYIQIELDKVSGLPRAIITAGKGDTAFSQELSEMPMIQDNLTAALNEQTGVIGLTVGIPVDALPMVDAVALSVFENGEGDLEIDEKLGLAASVKGQLGEKVRAELSAMMKETAEDQDMEDMEKRATLGVVYDNGDGTWTVYAQGSLFDNVADHADANYAGTIGATYNAGPGTVVVEYSFIEATAQEIGAAYKIPVGSNLVLAPEIRHRMNEGDQDDSTTFGIRATLKFKKEASKALHGN